MKKLQAALKKKKSMQFRTDSVDYRILVIGLESSGKSCIVGMIVDQEAMEYSFPTYGVNVVPLLHPPNKLIFHEVGGNVSSRGLMKYYYSCEAVICVIDSSQRGQLTKAEYIEQKHNETKVASNQISDDVAQNNSNYTYTDNKYRIYRSKSFDLSQSTDAFLDDPSPISLYTYQEDEAKENNHSFFKDSYKLKRRVLGKSKSVAVGVLYEDHTTLSSNCGSLILQPLTMNEAKCESAQELISKINYDLKSMDIPFLIYFNKQDVENALNAQEMIKRIEFERIISKKRIYKTFACNATNKNEVFRGFFWLLDTLKGIRNKKKENAKLMSQRNIDLSKYGPNVENPVCVICDESCEDQGVFCSVCGKWYCPTDSMTKIRRRKSGHKKCKECVGQKSRFVEQTRK